MTRQILELRESRPVVVETPEGLISITIDKKRKVRLELPGEMRAHRGQERALEHLRFLQVDADGTVRPKYEVLTPRLDDKGRLIGVRMPTPLVVSGG